MLSWVLVVGAAVNLALGGPLAGVFVALTMLFSFFAMWLANALLRERIDVKLKELLGHQQLKFKVVQRDLPDYRFVDVFRAVEAQLGSSASTLDSVHTEDLGAILGGNLQDGQGVNHEPALEPHWIAPNESKFFSAQRLWVRKPESSGQPALIVRLRHVPYTGLMRLEVASTMLEDAESRVAEIEHRSIANSIYRSHPIEVSFAAGVTDPYGGIDQVGTVKVDFRRDATLKPEDIVLDPRSWPIIEHSVVRFNTNRPALLARGIALKRGFLFHGPPGTGKSFTTRYIASLLSDTTVVYCAGAALHHVSSAFNLARLLNPALIVVEDVDLVFSSRDINQRGATLGELFDHLDALADCDAITIIFTTNAIDRVEAAIKDRPGRVSQCIYFGPPSAELRERYLLSYLKQHDVGEVDVWRVARDTQGASQAFLKELVQRALQFAVEAGRASATRAHPTTSDFVAALEEMRTFDGKSARAITGFKVDASDAG